MGCERLRTCVSALDLGGLPRAIAAPLQIALDAGRRFYVAAIPASPGILRHKDAAGLAEWCGRTWRRFPHAPEIHDVTGDVPTIWRELISRPGRRVLQGTMRGFLGGVGLGFEWAERRLVLFEEWTAPCGVSDLTADATVNELLGLSHLATPAPWIMYGAAAAAGIHARTCDELGLT
jgi:hypothetical protein